MSPQLQRTLEGAPIILLMVVGALVALFWVFLPVVVWSRLNEIVKLLKEVRDNTGDTVDRLPRPAGGAKPESGVKYRGRGDSS